MATTTDHQFRDDDTFRFNASRGIYQAIRQNSLWRVTLEGNTERWMFWVVSDETVLKDFWDSRLTD